MNELKITVVSPGKTFPRVILEAKGTFSMINGIYNHYSDTWKKAGCIPDEKFYPGKRDVVFRQPSDSTQLYDEYVHMVWTF